MALRLAEPALLFQGKCWCCCPSQPPLERRQEKKAPGKALRGLCLLQEDDFVLLELQRAGSHPAGLRATGGRLARRWPCLTAWRGCGGKG